MKGGLAMTKKKILDFLEKIWYIVIIIVAIIFTITNPEVVFQVFIFWAVITIIYQQIKIRKDLKEINEKLMK